jgi:hypothetical protein
MFKVIKLDEDFWAVFLVNRYNDKDRYMVSSPLEEKDAERFLHELNRIERESRYAR